MMRKGFISFPEWLACHAVPLVPQAGCFAKYIITQKVYIIYVMGSSE